VSEIKAELVYMYPMNLHAGGYENPGEPGTTPHFIIPAAGVPDDDCMQVLMDRFGRNSKTASMEIAFARHVLDTLGLKEVK